MLISRTNLVARTQDLTVGFQHFARQGRFPNWFRKGGRDCSQPLLVLKRSHRRFAHVIIRFALCSTALIAIADLLTIPAASQTYSIDVTCTSTGQLCTPAYMAPITLASPAQLTVDFVLSPTLCSNAQVYIFLDGALQSTSAFLPPGGDTGPINLGTSSAGTHTVSVQAEGEVGGCNTGSLASWGGALSISETTPPTLSISGLSPNSVMAGAPAFALTVSGSGFLSGATVLWNGSALTTSYTSGNQLSASVPANLIASPGAASVSVQNPGGATSNTLTFTISQPGTPPTLTSLSPNSAAPGGPAFTLTVYGSGFVNGAIVEWNGSPLSTNSLGSPTQVTASVPAYLIASSGTANVTVVNPNGTSSNTITFTITSMSPLSVAQIVDGGTWQTLFQVVNLDQVPVTYSFQFWADNGTPLQLPFLNGPAGTFAGTLPVGGTAFAVTPGTAAALAQGWANVTSSGRIGVLTIFRQSVPGNPTSEGTVIGVQAGSRVFLPFDNTRGYVTGVAVANTNATQTLSISLTFQTDSGAISTGSLSLPPNAHTAFVLTSMFPALAGLRGSIEFTTPLANIAVLGLRFSPTNSFTSLGEFQ